MNWTYFIQAIDGGPIKIGFTSTAPEARLSALQTGSPLKLQFIGLMEDDREKELHKKFAKERIHGEWFSPSSRLTDFIRTHCSATLSKRIKELQEHAMLDNAVEIAHVSPPEIRASHFDHFFPNNESLFCAIEEFAPFDSDTIGIPADELDDFDPDEDWCIKDYILNMVCEILGNSFMEAIGINTDAGYVCFVCGPCNSGRRKTILHNLGVWASYVDDITDRWFFFAILNTGGVQIGVDLLRAYLEPNVCMTEGLRNALFEPLSLHRLTGYHGLV